MLLTVLETDERDADENVYPNIYLTELLEGVTVERGLPSKLMRVENAVASEIKDFAGYLETLLQYDLEAEKIYEFETE